MKRTPPPFFNLLSIQGLLKEAIQWLTKCSDSPALDAELLLAYCLKKNRTYLHTWPEKALDSAQIDCYQKLIEKRMDEYPVAYLLGTQSFWTLDLKVTPDVLIPRPETELLVETVLDKITAIKNPKILDLGTGSGAIALALASEREDASIVATDNSTAALSVAKENALNNSLKTTVTFIQSNWFSKIKENNFDLIVSNPPYIAPNDPHLLKTIRHEPRSALAADNAGIKDIQVIIQKSPDFLKNKGWLVLEHGYDQSEQTQALLTKNGFSHCSRVKDLNNHYRVTLAQLIK